MPLEAISITGMLPISLAVRLISGVKVGLLDTGVDPTHPDLEGKVTDWAEFDASGAQVPSSQPHDSGEHGTHCAGIIAGGNASGQWIGVAPEVKIAAAMVLKGKRGGTDAQILAGMQWAVESGVDVINMSLGGVWFDPEVRDDYMNTFISCLRLGIPVVVAIGNAGAETTGTPGNDFFAFSVGATDHKDRIAGFSGGRPQGAPRRSPDCGQALSASRPAAARSHGSQPDRRGEGPGTSPSGG